MHAYDKLASKYDNNKKLISELNDENDCLLFYNECLKFKNSELKKIVSSYSLLSVELLDLRKNLVARENVLSKLNVSKNLQPHIRCFLCGNIGHKSFNCPHKKKPPKGKLVWAPKGSKPIRIGSSATWVSKPTS